MSFFFIYPIFSKLLFSYLYITGQDCSVSKERLSQIILLDRWSNIPYFKTLHKSSI